MTGARHRVVPLWVWVADVDRRARATPDAVRAQYAYAVLRLMKKPLPV